VSDRFFGFAAGELEPVVTGTTVPATERLTDLGTDRLDRLI